MVSCSLSTYLTSFLAFIYGIYIVALFFIYTLEIAIPMIKLSHVCIVLSRNIKINNNFKGGNQVCNATLIIMLHKRIKNTQYHGLG